MPDAMTQQNAASDAPTSQAHSVDAQVDRATDIDALDVIVIGAGLAGLGAAHALGRAGKRVAVLEGRARAGGRVHTRRDALTDYAIELGPEWLESDGEWRALLDSVNAGVRPATGHHLERRNASLVSSDEMQDGVDELIAVMHDALPDGEDRTLEHALQLHATDERFAAARAMLVRYVEGFHAADPKRVSLRWLREVEESEPASASQSRATAGLDWGIDALIVDAGETVRLHLDTRVTRVAWTSGTVVVHAEHGGSLVTYRAPKCIVTLPLGVLQHAGGDGDVEFVPPLAAKAQAFAGLAMGHVRKCVLVFDEPFWESDGALRHASFLQDFSQPVPTWWTPLPSHAPVLTGWLAGPKAGVIGHANDAAFRDEAVRSVAHATGVTVESVTARLRGFHWHDWSADPFSRGAYSYVVAGGIEAYKALAEPLDDTLYFAGEATAGEGHNATMEGALQSGRRAASEILR